MSDATPLGKSGWKRSVEKPGARPLPENHSMSSFKALSDGLAKMAADWRPEPEELYDMLANYELTPEARRGAISKLKEAHEALITKKVRESRNELMWDLDEIDNKPWRAARQLAKLFEDEGDTERAEEYRKLEAFYSNGGSRKIDELLANPGFNVNYPQYHEATIAGVSGDAAIGDEDER